MKKVRLIVRNTVLKSFSEQMIRTLLKRAKNNAGEVRTNVVQGIANFLPRINEAEIYDCFLFYNELDLLRLRIKELYDHVDYIVICECSVSFSGQEKQLFYHLNRHSFAEYSDKIKHFIIPNPPSSAYVLNPTNPDFSTSEPWQRNQIAVAVQSARPYDLILVSDVDEIPKAKILDTVYKICYWADCVIYFRQSWFLLYLNTRVVGCNQVHFASRGNPKFCRNDKWLGTFACLAKRLRKRYDWNLNGVWGMKWGDHRLAEPIIDDAGWHFSYIGGMNSILSKIKAWGTQLYTKQDVEDIRAGRFIGCDLSIERVDLDYPDEIKNHPELWKHLINQESDFDELAKQYISYNLNEPC